MVRVETNEQEIVIPRSEWLAWRAHRHRAARRGIPFHLTAAEWYLWWKAELAKHGPDAQRGRLAHQFVMSRPGDQGAYELGNIRCVHPGDNRRDVPGDANKAAALKAVETRRSR